MRSLVALRHGLAVLRSARNRAVFEFQKLIDCERKRLFCGDFCGLRTACEGDK